MSRVPIPPADAERRNTVCQFCIVGCGYRVYKWPEGREGGRRPGTTRSGSIFASPCLRMPRGSRHRCIGSSPSETVAGTTWPSCLMENVP